MTTARGYQVEAIEGNNQFPGILSALRDHQSTLLVMATGLGKSVCISKLAAGWEQGRVLILAHRIELIDQMHGHICRENRYGALIEQGLRGLPRYCKLADFQNIVIGSIQSMITERRQCKFANCPFGLIVIDEAHRATSPSYVKLVDTYRKLNPNLRVLGVTATPNRSDGTAMGLVFDSVAYEMGILEGINSGWLVDVHQKFAKVDQLDLDKIPCKRNEFGEMDFSLPALEELLAQEGPLHEMSRPILDCTSAGQQGIIFAASVKHAHLWAAVLNHYRPGCAAALDGTMRKGPDSPREHVVKNYKRGNLQFLINYNIMTEGFDAPSTSFIVMGRPTKSKLVYTQMLGRCTRVLPGVVDGIEDAEARKLLIANSTKPFATVLDFTGNCTRHNVITAADILGGNEREDVRRAAAGIVGARGTGSVLAALGAAKACLLLEAEETKREKIRCAVEKANVEYSLQDVSPFGGVAYRPAARTSRGGSTDAQVNALVNFGVKKATALGYNRRQAGAVLDSIARNRCTIKQAELLKRFGYKAESYNFKDANAIISKLAANGWKRDDQNS